MDRKKCRLQSYIRKHIAKQPTRDKETPSKMKALAKAMEEHIFEDMTVKVTYSK